MVAVSSAEIGALAAAARDGDVAAFERLFQMHHVAIYNYLAYAVSDSQIAEDLTQQVFIRAWESLPRLKAPEAFVSWLYRIARNLARDHLRSRRAPDLSLDDSHEGVLALQITNGRPEHDPATAVLASEESQLLRRAVAALPEHQREAVVLHHIQGMPVEDVAKALGVPLGTVLSRLARAREALARKLRPVLGEEV